MKVVQINSGELGFSETGEVFQTLLGSCVSVCIYDPIQQIGGIIHYLLPKCADKVDQTPSTRNPLNFGNVAIPALLKEFKKRGSQPQNLISYLVGGAKFGPRTGVHTVSVDIGEENIQYARETLKKFGVAIKKELVGIARSGLLIRFDSKNGEILVEKKSLQNLPTDSTIKVLIVDDSSAIRKLLRKSLEVHPHIQIVGEAQDPVEAEELRKKHNPDVITLDVQMPKKDGITYLKEIHSSCSSKIILISDLSLQEASPIMEGLENGAFDYIQKPMAQDLSTFSSRLVETIQAAHKLSVRSQQGLYQQSVSRIDRSKPHIVANPRLNLIVIGSSTGGISALRQIFAELPAQTPPILIAQHMPSTFSKAFSDGLNASSKVKVKEAAHGDVLEKNTAYIAPGGQQMKLVKQHNRYVIHILQDDGTHSFAPCVDLLFQSVAGLDIACKTKAVLLTGMGSDGALGMAALKKAGSKTVAQNEETCAVFGMPKAAIEMEVADQILGLDEIAIKLVF